jgi:hypothetical protein
MDFPGLNVWSNQRKHFQRCRNTSTGQGAWRTTRSVVLPNSACFKPVKPCVEMMIKSILRLRAIGDLVEGTAVARQRFPEQPGLVFRSLMIRFRWRLHSARTCPDSIASGTTWQIRRGDRFNDVQQRQLCSELLGKRHGVGQRFLECGGKVRGHKDRLDRQPQGDLPPFCGVNSSGHAIIWPSASTGGLLHGHFHTKALPFYSFMSSRRLPDLQKGLHNSW